MKANTHYQHLNSAAPPAWRLLNRGPLACSADFPICRIADFQVGGAPVSSPRRRFGNLRYGRFGNLRYGLRRQLSALAVLGFLVAAPCARAADIVWTNTAGGNWSTAANWKPNQVPASADTAWITNNGTYAVTLNANATVTGLQLGGDSGTQTLNHTAGTLTLNGPGSGTTNAVYNLSGGGELAGSGSLTLAGPMNWTGGYINLSSGSLIVTASGGLVLSTTGTRGLHGGMLINQGPGSCGAGVSVQIKNAIFSNAPSATFDLAGDNQNFSNPGLGRFANAGTLRKTSGTGTSTFQGVVLDNSGTVEVQTGTLSLSGGGSSSGTFQTWAGATLDFSSVGFNSTYTLQASSLVTGAGTVRCSGDTVNANGPWTLTGGHVISGGIENFNGTGQVGSLTLSGGTLRGSGSLAVAGQMNWTSGYINLSSGSLIVTASGGLVLSTTGSKGLNGGFLVNAGPGSWSGATVGVNANGVVSNAASGTFDLAGDGTAFVEQYLGTGFFANAGTLRKSSGTGTTTLSTPCHNSGTVEVKTGTLSLSDGGSSSGTFQTWAGATLDFSSAGFNSTHTLQASSWVTGAGTVRCSGDTVNANGPWTLTGGHVVSGGTENFNGTGQVGSLTLSGGTLQGSGTLNIIGQMSWNNSSGSASVSGNPTIIANGGLVVSQAGSKGLSGGLLVNAGPGSWSGATVGVNANGVVSNAASGTFDLAGDGTAFVEQYLGTGFFANAGTLRKSSGTGTTTLSTPCHNSGTVEVKTGTLSLSDGGSSSGTFQTWAGATLDFSSAGFNSTHTLQASSLVTGAGTVRCSGDTVNANGPWTLTGGHVVSGGTENFNGVGQVGALTVSGGTLRGSGSLAVAGQMNWTSGYINSPSGSLIVTASGGVVLSTTVTKYLSGGMLVNAGPGSCGTGVSLGINNAIFSNAPSATFDLAGDNQSFWWNVGVGRFVNAGTLRKTSGTGTSTFSSVPLDNSGTVEAQTGTLSFGSSLAQTSGQTLLNGGALSLSQTMQLQGGRLAGTGTLTGSVNNTGGLVSPGASPGLLTITGGYTQGTNGTLNIELGGTLPGTGYDRLAVVGAATLAGAVNATLTNSFVPSVGMTFRFLTNASRSGTFAKFNYPSNGMSMVMNYAATGATMQVTYLQPPPLISNIVATPSLTRCTVTFKTDSPASSQIEYGLNTSYGTTTPLSVDSLTNHSITLSNLAVNTTYYYRIHAFDGINTEVIAGDLYFMTLPDVTPPTLALGSVPANVCSLPLVISWSATDDATAAPDIQFSWRLDGGSWSSYATQTSATCTELAEGAHTFQLKARDAVGNESSTPASATFNVDTTVPQLSALSATPAQNRCDLTWRTDEPGTTQVEYGPDSGYGQATAFVSQLTTNHTAAVTSLMPSTTYHYRVKSQDSCGRLTMSADGQFTTLPAPDLQVVSVGQPVEAWTDSAFDVSWVLTNTGPAVAVGQWMDKVYLSADTNLDVGSDLLLGQFQFDGNLDPGQSIERVQTVTIGRNGITNGQYYLLVAADANNSVFEGYYETNNLGVSAPLPVYVAPLPDLVVDGVYAPTNSMGGQVIEVSWLVWNDGAGATDLPLWYDHLYLSPTTNKANAIKDYGQFANPAWLAPGEVYEQAASIRLPCGISGPHYFIAETDSGHQLLEESETNNVGYAIQPIDIQFTPLAFLHVESVQVAPAPPTTVWAGEPVTLTFVVRNTGGEEVPGSFLGWDHAFAFCSAPDLSCTSPAYWHREGRNAALAAGASYTNQLSLTVPSELTNGTYNLVVLVDPPLWTTAGRDLGATPIQVAVPAPADLEVTALAVPTNANPSQTISVQWTVANKGLYRTIASYWYDVVYLATNEVFDPLLSRQIGTLGHWGTLDLSAAYSQIALVTVPSDTLGTNAGPVTNYLFVVTDGGNAVKEITKTNNLRGIPLVISPVPPALPADLAVTAVTAPGTAVAGREATVSWTVANVSTNPTTSTTWLDNVYLSADTSLDSGDTSLGAFRHDGALTPGASYTQTQPAPLPNCSAGQWYVIVVTDSAHQVDEGGLLKNNVGASPGAMHVVPSTAARLQVLAVNAPSAVTAGDPLTVSWTVTNVGSATVTAPWVDAFYLSAAPQFDPTNALLLGTCAHTANVPANGLYTQPWTSSVPVCLAGPYYVHVLADLGHVVNAISCETNNRGRSEAAVQVAPAAAPVLQVIALDVPPATDSGAPWTLTWTVTNSGPAAATGPWTDAVYAATSPALDNNVLLLARISHPDPLTSGAAYSQTQSVAFPACISGDYYVFVVADVDSRVNIPACQINHQLRSTDPMTVNSGLWPDLQVTGISTPASATAGQPFSVSWTLTNAGVATATAPWTDSVYVAPAINLSQRTLVGAFTQSAPIPAGSALSPTASVTLPFDIYGTFQVVIVTDSSNGVQECQHENNNTATNSATIQVAPATCPDLQVTGVQGPASAFSGQNVSVSWVVANTGTGPTGGKVWYDALYFSRDQIFDPVLDTRLGTYARPSGLAAGESYTNSATISIPPSASGPCYFIAVADSGGNLFEYVGENNNLGLGAVATLVTMPGLADLVPAVSITPATAMPGDPVTVTWMVHNTSTNDAPAAWTDAIYLSTNRVWDISAVKVTTRNHGALPAGASYTDTWTGPLPGLNPGPCYALARTDIYNTAREANETNNVAASPAIGVDITELVLGEFRTNQLSTGTAHYYKFNVAAGETVLVTLDSASTNSANELYIRYGVVPDLGHYDFMYDRPLESDQQIEIPTTGAGWYYVLVRGANVPDAPAAYQITAGIVPFAVSSLNTYNMGDDGQVTLVIHGARFAPATQVGLLGTNVSYCPANTFFTDGTTLKARFQFTSALHGQYSLVLTNPGGAVALGPYPVTIEAATPLQAELVDGLVDTSPRAGTFFRWNGSVRNAGNVDIPYLSTCVIIDPAFPTALTPPPEAIPTPSGAESILNFTMRDTPPQNGADFSFVVSGFGDQDFDYDVETIVESKAALLAGTADMAERIRQYLLNSTNAHVLTTDEAAALGTTASWAAYAAQSLTASGLLDPTDILPPPGLAPEARQAALLAGLPSKYGSRKDYYKGLDPDEWVKCMTRIWNTYSNCIINSEKYVLCMDYSGTKNLCFETARRQKTDCEGHFLVDWDSCFPPEPEKPCPTPPKAKLSFLKDDGGAPTGHRRVCPVPPKDPNEKTGPVTLSDTGMAGVQQPWAYTIFFENVSNALAWARQVRVTDKLDPSLDIRSFRLQEIKFGDVTVAVPTNRSLFQGRVALAPPHATNVVADISAGVDLQNNQVVWTLNAIDLNTGELVADASQGLLPPNDTNHVGEGYVKYTLLPKAGMPTGTVVTNQATIVFDTNEPLDTNPTTNTVDAVTPTSTVFALPTAVLETNFIVAWFGTDDAGGAGVNSYDIYVSDNGSAWTKWLSATDTNLFTFSGKPGHYYYFYSRARDNAGNVEPAPANYQAMTYISNNRPPTLPPLADQAVNIGGTLVFTNAASDPDGLPGGLTYSLQDAPFGMTINPTNGVIVWRPRPWQAGRTNLITVTVTDNGLPPRSASQSFLAMVGEYAESSLGTLILIAGQPGCVPLNLVSSASLTNLTFTLALTPGVLTDLAVNSSLPEVVSPQLTVLDPGHALVSLSTAPGMVLVGTQEVAQVCFTTLPHSGMTPLAIQGLLAWKPDGTTVNNLGLGSGRVIVLGENPILEAAGGGPGLVQVTVYSVPGGSYDLESSVGLAGGWSPVGQVTLTNQVQTLIWTNDLEATRLFRLKQR